MLSENWAVYSYIDDANRRHALSVVELYDVTHSNITIPTLLFGQGNATFSSYSPSPIQVPVFIECQDG